MLMASHSRSSIGCLLYLLGNCHHSKLPVAGGGVDEALAGAGGSGGGITDSTFFWGRSLGTIPFLELRMVSLVPWAALQHYLNLMRGVCGFTEARLWNIPSEEVDTTVAAGLSTSSTSILPALPTTDLSVFQSLDILVIWTGKMYYNHRVLCSLSNFSAWNNNHNRNISFNNSMNLSTSKGFQSGLHLLHVILFTLLLSLPLS